MPGRVKRVRSAIKEVIGTIYCRSAQYSADLHFILAGRTNRVPMGGRRGQKVPVDGQIEAPEVTFPMAQTLHQNSSCAESYALFREAAQTRSNRDDAQLQPIISPPPGLGSRRFLNQK